MPRVGNGLVGGRCGAGTGAIQEELGKPPMLVPAAAAAALAWLAAVAGAGGDVEGGGGGHPFNIDLTAIAWIKKRQGPSSASSCNKKSRQRLLHQITTFECNASWDKPIAQKGQGRVRQSNWLGSGPSPLITIVARRADQVWPVVTCEGYEGAAECAALGCWIVSNQSHRLFRCNVIYHHQTHDGCTCV